MSLRRMLLELHYVFSRLPTGEDDPVVVIMEGCLCSFASWLPWTLQGPSSSYIMCILWLKHVYGSILLPWLPSRRKFIRKCLLLRACIVFAGDEGKAEWQIVTTILSKAVCSEEMLWQHNLQNSLSHTKYLLGLQITWIFTHPAWSSWVSLRSWDKKWTCLQQYFSKSPFPSFWSFPYAPYSPWLLLKSPRVPISQSYCLVYMP